MKILITGDYAPLNRTVHLNDTTRPNGTLCKLLDVSKAEKLGWKYSTNLEEGIKLSYFDFLNNPMGAER